MSGTTLKLNADNPAPSLLVLGPVIEGGVVVDLIDGADLIEMITSLKLSTANTDDTNPVSNLELGYLAVLRTSSDTGCHQIFSKARGTR